MTTRERNHGGREKIKREKKIDGGFLQQLQAAPEYPAGHEQVPL